MWVIFIVYLWLQESGAEPDFQKCMEVNTYGYRYDALYKIAPHSVKGKNRIDFSVKTVSDAHILLTSNPNMLEVSSVHDTGFTRTPKMLEVVIGGGKNSFSAIRQARVLGQAGATLVHTATPDILSPNEYRGFWIDIDPRASISVGQAKNDTPFMVAAAVDAQQEKIMAASYFGISVWNNIKGHWKIGCSSEGESEISGIEEVSMTTMQKLRRDVTLFTDPGLPPGVDTTVQVAFHYYRFYVSWSDPRLKWESENYNNITSMLVQATDIWTPDLEFFSDGGIITEDGMDIESEAVLITYEGSLEWRTSFQTTFYCDLPIVNWPFDKYTCILHVGFAYMMLTDYVDQVSLGNVILTGAPINQWQMDETASVSNWDVKHHFEDQGDGVTFYLAFHFQRKGEAFVSLITTPFICLAVMGLSGFWLHVGSKVKLHIHCFTCVLLTVFLTIIAYDIPPNAIGAPSIVKLYTWGLSLSCLSILFHVAAENMKRCSQPLPHWCTLLLTSRVFENVLCLQCVSQDSGIYNSLKKPSETDVSADWMLITTAVERVMFIVYVCVYITLIVPMF